MKKENMERLVFVSDIPPQAPKTLYRVFIDDKVDDQLYYREIYDGLMNASENDVFEFIINTPGGYLDTTVELCTAIMETKAETRAVIFKAYSAGSIIALCCDKIDPTKHGSMMIHDIWGGNVGKFSDIGKSTEFMIKTRHKFYDDIYGGFLTEDELTQIKENGKEFWFDCDEIVRRLERADNLLNQQNNKLYKYE